MGRNGPAWDALGRDWGEGWNGRLRTGKDEVSGDEKCWLRMCKDKINLDGIVWDWSGRYE